MDPIGIRLILAYVSLIVIGLIPTGQISAEIDSESIVGVWLFDEGSGKTARDSSGKGNNGNLSRSCHSLFSFVRSAHYQLSDIHSGI